jgi:DNA-binding response OmpR family regulator
MWPLPSHSEQRQTGATPEVVALLGSPSDQATIQNCAKNAGWRLVLADTIEHALLTANSGNVALFVVDRDLVELDWRPYVQKFAKTRSAPCILLASPVVDRYLFEELVKQGGFDVVPKPIETGQLLRLSRLAIAYWKNRRAAISE